MIRALKIAIDMREVEKSSFLVRAGSKTGRIIDGGDDLTELIERDLREFKELQRRMR